MTQDFSKCKIGDKLWSIQLGDCEVVDIHSQLIKCSSSQVYGSIAYYHNGFQYRNRTDSVQSLYWSNPNIIPPPKPKQIVKGELERWVAVYKKYNGDISHSPLFCSYKLCIQEYNPLEYKISKITIPYEFEE